MLNERSTLLIVDDTPENISLMCRLLENDYALKVANSGERALSIALSDDPPDLILLDIVMPGMDGFEVCRVLKADPRTDNIPVIFITAMSDIADEQKGFDVGGADYIAKPISPPILLARVRNHLALKTSADFLRDKAEDFGREVYKRTRELMAIQNVTIHAMASLAETRDTDTGNHIRRTQNYVKALALKLRRHPRFAAIMTHDYIETLFRSAPLHDIGKVGIPDRILLKPGKLDFDEFEIMKTHTTLGRDAIQSAEDALGMRVDFLSVAKEIAYGHQEKWDGSGYPLGLAGDAIPVSARLMAVADVYDALISRRVYKEPMSHEKAVVIIGEGRAKHFDPDIADAFIELQDEFRAIAERYSDSDADMARKKELLDRLVTSDAPA